MIVGVAQSKEMEDYADELKKELSVVKGVARVELWGVQDKVVYIEAAEKQLSYFMVV